MDSKEVVLAKITVSVNNEVTDVIQKVSTPVEKEMVDVEIRLPADVIAKIKQIGMDVETAVTHCMAQVSKSFKKKRYFPGCNREHKQNPPRKPGWTLVKYPLYMKYLVMFQSSPTATVPSPRQTGKSRTTAGLFLDVVNLFMVSRLKKSDPLRRDICLLMILASSPGTTKEMCEERIKELLAKYQFAE